MRYICRHQTTQQQWRGQAARGPCLSLSGQSLGAKAPCVRGAKRLSLLVAYIVQCERG